MTGKSTTLSLRTLHMSRCEKRLEARQMKLSSDNRNRSISQKRHFN